ncbi:MAG TPA: hypothetical protein ACHBY7_12475, partial [Arsenophonus sp.]
MLNFDTLGLSAKVTDDGISAPDYQTLLMRLTDFFHEIYGQDAYLTPDSKDGQMIAIYALVTDHAKLIRYFIRTQYNGVLASQIRHDLLIQVIYELKCDVTGSGWA